MSKELVDIGILLSDETTEHVFEVATDYPITFKLKPVSSKLVESLKTKCTSSRGKTNTVKLMTEIAKHMVVGWQPFAVSGKELPYSHANVAMLVEKIPAFYQWINVKASDYTGSLDEFEEEAEKN